MNDSIPFKYAGHLYFPAVVNDSIRCNLIFDTGGADIFGVDSVFLAQSKWKPSSFAEAKAGGAAGAIRVRIITDSTKVTIGDNESAYTIVPIFSLRDILGCHADGIIGNRDVNTTLFEINFEHGYMRRHHSMPAKIAEYTRIPIVYKNHKILFDATVRIGNTVIRGPFLMDTGSGGTIDFTSEATRKYKLDSIRRKKQITDISNFGIGSKEKEYYTDMQSDLIVIGEDTIKKRVVSYLPQGVGALSKRKYLGIVGNAIWSKYNLLLDIVHQCVYVKRFKKDKAASAEYDYGFRNRTDICDGWIVSSLVRDGDAAKAGMELGDTIVAVNGKPAKAFTWDEEENVDDVPVQILDIKGVDGKAKRVKLEARERW
ncbi:hypothetical protein C3V39_09360 [Prevotella sp. oral taxon 820]|nr:hypothetical protein C3V39_09360 [Prevotella sp. oral taxon 820]